MPCRRGSAFASSRREELIRPLRWVGPGGQLRGSYGWARDRLRSDTQLNAGAAYLQNRYGHGAIGLDLDLRSTLGWRVLARGRHGLHAGAAFTLQYDPTYYFSWDEEHLYWLLSYDLGPALRWQLALDEKNVLVGELSFPLGGFVARPPARRLNKIDDLIHVRFWIGEPHEHLRFTSLHEYVAVRARALFMHALRNWLALRAGYDFGYRRVAFPEPLQRLEQSVWLEAVFSW
jgi:hypothetical protein